MFRCQITGRLTRPGDKCNKIVVLRRAKSYWKWIKNEDGDFVNTEISRGYETMKEVNASAEGLRLWNQQRKEDAIANGFEDVEAYEKSLMIKDGR
jgi:hypothetical protein